MAKKTHVLAALLAAPLSLGPSHDAEAALPDMEAPPALFRDIEVPAIGASGPLGLAAIEALPAACPVPSLDGAEVRGRMFSSSFDVKWPDGSLLGRIDAEGDGWVFRGAGGELIAKAAETVRDGTRAIAVTGCAGEALGEVVEADAPYGGERSFEVKDASGRVTGRTGTVGYLQSRWGLAGEGGTMSIEDDHWFLDSWRLRGAADGRLAVFAVLANSAANRRESSERHRERMGDHPGRGDR